MNKLIFLTALMIAAVASKNINTFVSNGNNAGRHDFPFKAGLISTTERGELRCGGSLISRVSVLTAASCIYGASDTVIILGGSDKGNPTQLFQSRFRVQASNYRIHPMYRVGVTNSDVGIVRFNFALAMFTQAVNIVPLSSTLGPYANEAAIVMGFGQYSDNVASTDNLRFIEVVTMTNFVCGINFPGRIDASHICTAAGPQRRGICPGDEGAPLVIERNNEYIQIGIASLFPGSGCTTTSPSVYTRISSFLPWIQQNM